MAIVLDPCTRPGDGGGHGARAVAPALADRARLAAATMLAELDGVVAVLIAAADGVPLARAGRLPPGDVPLAAAGNALVRFAEAVAGHGPIGELGCLFIEAGAGRALVRRLRVDGVDLVALLFADKGLPFALAASRIGQIEIAMGPG